MQDQIRHRANHDQHDRLKDLNNPEELNINAEAVYLLRLKQRPMVAHNDRHPKEQQQRRGTKRHNEETQHQHQPQRIVKRRFTSEQLAH